MVEEVYRNLAQMMTLRVGGHTIETMPEHPFWVRGRGWTSAEESKGLTIGGLLWGLVPGRSLIVGYQAYQKVSYARAAFNGAMGLIDLARMGTVSKAKALVNSCGKADRGVNQQMARFNPSNAPKGSVRSPYRF